MRMSCKSKIHFIWETLHSTHTPSSDQGKLQFCFRFDISTNERVQCNKFSKSQEKIKGKRKLSQFLISDFRFLFCISASIGSSLQRRKLLQLQQIDLVAQHMSLGLSVSIPHHTPHPTSVKGSMAYPRSARKSTTLDREREGQRDREREIKRDLIERNDSLLVYNKKCFNYFVQFTTTSEGCGSKSQGNQEGNSLCVFRLLCLLDGDFLYVFAFRDCLGFVLLPLVRCLPCNLFMHI